MIYCICRYIVYITISLVKYKSEYVLLYSALQRSRLLLNYFVVGALSRKKLMVLGNLRNFLNLMSCMYHVFDISLITLWSNGFLSLQLKYTLIRHN